MAQKTGLRLRWDWKRSSWEVLDKRGKRVQYRFRQWLRRCLECGQETPCGAGAPLCNGHRAQHWERQRLVSRAARIAVSKAIKEGRLPPLDGSIACVDCGRAAEVWEHREYERPLDVDPVCRSCNCRRGPAKEMRPLWWKKIPAQKG